MNRTKSSQTQRMDQSTMYHYDKEFEYDKDHLYSALAESTDDYIYIGNLKTGTFRYPPAMAAEFDLPSQIVPDAVSLWSKLVHPDDKKEFLESNQQIADGVTECHRIEYRARNRYGNWVWLRCRGHMVRDEEGTPSMFAGIITNLGRKTNIDHVTGLHNKYELEEEIRSMILDFPDTAFGVMILDIDDFRYINDLYDRMFGDEVIRIVTQRISSLLPDGASVFRLDGDEFCILYKESDQESYRKLYRMLQQFFKRQQEYNQKKYYCSFSAGCSLYPSDGTDYLSLIKFANYSLEYSKTNGKNCMTMFSDEIMLHKERTLELTGLLRESIEHGYEGFFLNYQPQVETGTGRVVGAEALARWRCEKYGIVPPVEFIPILEQNNMIIRVGRWILREAARQCKDWLKDNPDFTMSINLSYLQVMEPGFTSFFRNVQEELQVPYKNLILELTETYLIKEQDYVTRIFRQIQGMGTGVAMDDFGTGYSSLGVLKDIPVDIVKIDQTFVRGIQDDAFDATFIRFVVALCHDVGKEVCLEGVETMEEYDIIKGSGVEYIQGYYFGRPVSAEEFETKYLT